MPQDQQAAWDQALARYGGSMVNHPGRELTTAVLAEVAERVEEQGLSLRYLAERVGMAYPTLRRNLRGEGDLTLDELDALARALHLNRAEELMADARRRL